MLTDEEQEKLVDVIVNDDVETMRRMLEDGMDPNVIMSALQCTVTPIQIATLCYGGVSIGVAKLLLDYGANPYSTNLFKLIGVLHNHPWHVKGRELAEMLLQYDPYLPTIQEGFKYDEFQKK